MKANVKFLKNKLSLYSKIFIILYLIIGFLPNFNAVDRIAPQWLYMSIVNLISISIVFYHRNYLTEIVKSFFDKKATLIYSIFFVWACGSYFYAINPTETLVNLSRQFNVLLMLFSMFIFLNLMNNKITFISWIIALILLLESSNVLTQLVEFIKTGSFDSRYEIVQGLKKIKGFAANRNITAFSMVIKLPIIFLLIFNNNKYWLKLFLSLVILISLVGLFVLGSRASIIALLLIYIAYTFYLISNYNSSKKLKITALNLGYILLPLFFSITLNTYLFSDKKVGVISEINSVAAVNEDNSINQRIRYYGHVISHTIKNPFFGVGLGNWKLKSIEYDKASMKGYVVPYHAHSDIIQLAAELGLVGFILYLGPFLICFYLGAKFYFNTSFEKKEKLFVFSITLMLLIYFIDANLNFPIARPQMGIMLTLIIPLILIYTSKSNNIKNTRIGKQLILAFFFLLTLPSIYISKKVYDSLVGQMQFLVDFNSNTFNIPINQVDTHVPEIPNITVTTIPINSIKARYYLNQKKYDKAISLLNKGTKANPYLFYSEILKSQIYQNQGKLDSAKVYARKAFFGLPNNDLHASRYLNLINITRDREALEEAFELITATNKLNNWKNYLIIASGLYKPKDNTLTEKARLATERFPGNQEIKALYQQIAVGVNGLNIAASYSSRGLEYFNAKDYSNAAIEFEKALEANPYDYAHFENAATANYLLGNLEKALDQIDVVIDELNPLNGKCEYIKAIIFIRMGDTIGACPFIATSRDSGYSQANALFDQYCR